MKASLILLAVLCITLPAEVCSGQNTKQESSFKKFKSRSSSERSAASLLDDADKIKSAQPQEALNKVEEALAISIAQSDNFNEGKSYELLGEINEQIQEWNLARDNYNQAYMKLSGAFSGSPEFQRTLRGLGNSNLQLKNYPDAIKYYQEGLSLRLNQNDKLDFRLALAEVYYQMGNYPEALNTLGESPSAGKTDRRTADTRTQNQRAKIYARQNELDLSRNTLSNSISVSRANKSVSPQEKESLKDTKEEIAGVLHEQKKYDDEINLRQQAVDYNIDQKNYSEVTKDKVEISKSLEAKGENAAALRELEGAVAIADTINDPNGQANAFLALALLYEKNGKTTRALTAYKKYSEAVVKKDQLTEARMQIRAGLITRQQDITSLSSSVSLGQREDIIERATVFRQQLIIYGLLFIILVIIVTSYFIYKNAQASKIANQLLALKSLRGQMNPHFIFNALNSVNHFIAEQDERTANKFLSEFSQLMRLVMENSQEDFIPMEREREILSLYLKLEHYRFRDKFSYEIEIPPEIHADAVEVPPMLIQPYIENAVWHGLRYREEKGKLLLKFGREGDTIVVEITDNGIGRVRSMELKTANQRKHNSTGLKNIDDRLAIINKVYKANYRVLVEDLANAAGTRVLIYLPIHHSTTGL